MLFLTIQLFQFCPLISQNMQNARFLQIFRTFTPQEFKLFGKFLASPIYNSNKTLIRLYNYIKTFYPEFSDVCLKKEIVFSKLYSGKIYKEKLLRNLSSEMLYASEEYLVYLRSQKNSTEKKISLISELSDRSLHALARTSIQSRLANPVRRPDLQSAAHGFIRGKYKHDTL